jgi:phage-related protein (TIGR01555 family)
MKDQVTIMEKVSSSFKTIGGLIRGDGWENVLTGLGVKGQDKRLGASAHWNRMTERALESLHDGDDIAHRVVNKIPEEGTEKWIEFSVADDMDTAKLIKKEDEDLCAKDKFAKAWAWSRLYGGSGIYMNLADGMTPDMPVDLKRVQKIKSLTVFHKFELYVHEMDYDLTSENYGYPLYYTVGSRYGGGYITKVHYSRVIRFDGSPLSRGNFDRNEYWDDSVLTKMLNALRNFNSAHDSAASVLQDFNITVLKLKNLADIIGGDDEGLVVDRLKLMRLGKSIMGTVLLDAENEEFSNLSTPLTGVDKVLDKVNERLVAATDMPHTIILGNGATGTLSGGGESEERNWKKLVNSQQDKVLTKNLNRFYEILLSQRQGPTAGKIPAEFTWKFVPLSTQTEKEITENRNKQAQTDKIYLDSMVLSPLDVAKNRFGGEEYSYETKIDIDEMEVEIEERELEEAKQIAIQNKALAANSIGGKVPPVKKAPVKK